jgi:hypothetical protein
MITKELNIPSQKKENNTVAVKNGKQVIQMLVSSHAYEPDITTLKAGVPVTLNLRTDHAQGGVTLTGSPYTIENFMKAATLSYSSQKKEIIFSP